MEDPPVSSLDIGVKLDAQGIAIRTGHHCCQPVMARFGIPGTARASFAFYNTTQEVDALAAALRKVRDEAASKPASVASACPLPQAVPAYPPAAADSPQAAADELIELFDFLEDWDQRYAAIIEMGEKLPAMPAEYKTEATRVRGCQSTVHLWGRRRPDSADTIEFLADSDADIVKGLIALLQRVYSGQRAADVLAFDVEGLLRRLGLDKYLTTGRRNGLAGMIQRIRSLAAKVQELGTE
jgi:cysteine desulfurase / selenocysteine lyase